MPHLDIIAAYAPRFFAATAGMPYTRRGIFWSELLAFAALADAAGATHVVESGTGLGHSARVLARLFPHVITIGLEDRPYGLPENVTFTQGDANVLAFSHVCAGTAFLIDGPKHEAAIDLAKRVYRATNLPLVAIHDCAKGMPARPLLEKFAPDAFFTDDATFVAVYGHMDKECLATAASRGKTFPTHGPTLGVVRL